MGHHRYGLSPTQVSPYGYYTLTNHTWNTYHYIPVTNVVLYDQTTYKSFHQVSLLSTTPLQTPVWYGQIGTDYYNTYPDYGGGYM